MNRLAIRFIYALVALFFLSYVVYQAWRYFYAPLKTETIYDYTVSYDIPLRGIAVRQEEVLERNRSGIESSVVDDGERVAVGQTIAEFHETSRGDNNQRRVRELESELESLREAQNTVAFSGVDQLNREIKEQLGGLSQMAGQKRFIDLDLLRNKMVLLLNKKQVASGRETGFASRISVLEQELEQLAPQKSSGRVETLTAPVSGYFVRELDGYERMLSPDAIVDFSIDDFFEIVENGTPEEIDGCGKLVTSQNWIFAGIVTEKHDVDMLRPGLQIDLRFDSLNRTIPATVSKILLNNDDERAVVLLTSDYFSGELAAIRKTDATVLFQQITGLRVNVSSIRFQGDKRGVYVLEENIVKFKLIDPVYEDANFVLSRVNYVDSSDREHLCMYEQIITKGNDLYDGKVIQER